MDSQEQPKEFVQIRNVRGYAEDLAVIAAHLNLGVSEAARQIARKEANRIRALQMTRKQLQTA